jgi:excisionase family DNA binding protein
MDNKDNIDNIDNKDNIDNIDKQLEKGNLVVYTVPDLCKLLNTTPQTVRRYINEGKIRGRKVGRQWLVDEDAVKEYLRGED